MLSTSYRLGFVCIALSLQSILLIGSAHAGTYQLVTPPELVKNPYGGTLSGTNPQGNVSSSPYTLTSGSYGGGTAPLGQASGKCSGEITAVYEWIPSDAADKPPTQVIVVEQCTSLWSKTPAHVVVTGDCDDGMGDSKVSVTDPNGQIIGEKSSGTRWTLVAGGSYVTLNITPTASFKGPTNPAPGSTLTCSVLYTPSLIPVKVNIGGKTLDSSDPMNPQYDVLTGQGLVASLSIGGLGVSKYTYSLSGPVFKSFESTTDAGGEVPFNATDYSKATIPFFSKDRGTIVASCNVVLSPPPPGITLGAGFKNPDGTAKLTLSAQSDNVNSFKPSSTSVLNVGTVFADNSGVYVSPLTLLSAIAITVPSPFQPTGSGCTAQIITPNRNQTEIKTNPTQTILLIAPSQGTDCLDNSFPYSFTYPSSFESSWVLPDQGVFKDGPAQTLSSNQTSSDYLTYNSANDSFSNWIMFQPTAVSGFPTSWVPLAKWTWSWAGNQTRNSFNSPWANQPTNPIPSVTPSATTDFPHWTKPLISPFDLLPSN